VRHAAHPHSFFEEAIFMSKRKTPVKPRNREPKGRGVSQSQAKECRHMWMDGVCVKCGIRFSGTQPEPNKTEK
jgi:hypothetical protein